MRLVVIEHDAFADELRRELERHGHIVEVFARGDAALERLSRRDFDAALIDLAFADPAGMELLSRARATGLAAPILVATTHEAVDQRIEAFDRGADDYLAKPFSARELEARLRALSRRATGPRWAPLTCGDVTLDPDSRDVVVASARIALSPRERALLELLLRRQGQVVSRADILRDVFGYDFDPGTNVIEVHIAHLRRKLAHASTRIETVRGMGYLLSDPQAGGGAARP